MNPVVSRRLRLIALCAVLGSSLVPALARANSASPADTRIPVRDVRVGETVELAWPGLPRAAREVEILLSVDGGARFSLRASAEVDVARGRVLWRVPALPTAHARLRLRWGDGKSENLAPPTPEFWIRDDAPARDAALAPWDEDDPSTLGRFAPGTPDMRSDRPTVSAGDDALPGVPGPDAPACATPPARAALPLTLRSTRPPAPPASPDATPARRSPQRE